MRESIREAMKTPVDERVRGPGRGSRRSSSPNTQMNARRIDDLRIEGERRGLPSIPRANPGTRRHLETLARDLAGSASDGIDSAHRLVHRALKPERIAEPTRMRTHCQ